MFRIWRCFNTTYVVFMKFIDYTKITVKSGNGGKGCVAFLREKFRPKGGPSGGDGGNGGNIIFTSSSKLSTLQDFTYQKKYLASSGEHGKGKNMHGKNGKNIILTIPTGTIVKNLDKNTIIHDFKKNNEEVVIAQGGNGGFGNARFKTHSNPAPRNANNGKEGLEINLELELKIIADVGLVGFPNAGKSTYISCISNAKPKIADYPFTTLHPNLGIVKYEDFNSFVVADIPGLITGASKGKGLGLKFLKHIERTKMLVFIIDINSENIKEKYLALCNELNSYNKLLLEKPKIILLSKIDSLDSKIDDFSDIIDIDVVKISSVANVGIKKSIQKIYQKLQSL